jgi:hypothetical protein
MSTKLTDPTLRKITVGLGCVVFLGTVAWLATFPISVGI